MTAPILIADLSAAIVAHLATARPDWSVAVTNENGRRIAVSDEGAQLLDRRLRAVRRDHLD